MIETRKLNQNKIKGKYSFVDLYGEEKMDPVDYPVLWICNSDHEPATIGETVYVNHYCSTV